MKVLITVLLLAGSLPGCAVLKNFPHNYNCRPADGAECQACHEHQHGPSPEAASVPEPIPHSEGVLPVSHWEEQEDLRGHLARLEEKDISLQEQLVMLDKNAEQQRQEGKDAQKEIQSIGSQVSALRDEMRAQKNALKQVETSLTEQRTKHEEVLASVEQQLIDVLEDYK